MTAVELAAKLGDHGRVLLDGARVDGGAGPWSYAASCPARTIVVRGSRVEVRSPQGHILSETHGRPMAAIQSVVDEFADEVGGPARPIAIGYLGYDLGAFVLPRLRQRWQGEMPDAYFGLYPGVWRSRHGHGAHWLGSGDPPSPGTLGGFGTIGALTGSESGDVRYRDGVVRALEYIAAGDVYQINLSRKLRAPIEGDCDVLALYCALAQRETVPFGAVIESDFGSVLSLSPEHFIRFRPGDRRVETRPIKGTTERCDNELADLDRARALSRSDKDLAEHLMIVDLERNDLGRIAQPGSVAVDDYAAVVSLSRVHHLVSTVSCTARQDVDFATLLEATFPGGSITGAPKIRAMQIIDELEAEGRGVYTGSIGYVGSDGSIELNIAIRTATLIGSELALRVGGGVVADSTVEGEFAETEAKAAGWRSALAALARTR